MVFVLTVGNDQMPCKMFGGGEYTVNMMIPKVGLFHPLILWPKEEVPTVGIKQKNVKVTKGEPKVYTYTGESGNPVDCVSCLLPTLYTKSMV